MPRIKEYKYDYLAKTALEVWEREQPEAIAVDTETFGVAWADRAFGISIAWDKQAHWIELEHYDGREIARTILREHGTCVFHNAKFDLQKLLLAGVLERDDLRPEQIADTECLAFLLDEHRPKKLKWLAEHILGAKTDETQAIKKYRRKNKIKVSDGLGAIPRNLVIPYAVKDAVYTWALYKHFMPSLPEDLYSLYAQEMELTLVLLDMEAAGMRVDTPYVNKTAKEYAGEILKTELRIGDLTGLKPWYPEKSGQKTPDGCLNPNAWQQTLPIIRSRGIDVTSTADDVLKPHGDDPFVGALLELRKLKKIYGTYLVGMQRETVDGILHPNYRQHGAKTGRMSSGKAEDG